MSTQTSRSGPSPRTRPGRHRLVDVLRGVALLGILVVNVEFIVQSSVVGWAGFEGPIDLAVRGLVVAFGQTKIYPLFAMLFGYGLSLQVASAERAGADLGPRHRRRMGALAVLGVLHGVLFFPGDILLIYAAVGALAFRLRARDSASLLRMAAWTYGAAAAVWLTAGVLDLVAGVAGSAVSPQEVAILTDGSFLEVVAQHVAYWPPTQLVLVAIQGPAVMAYYLVGVVVGRGDLLSEPDRHRDLGRVVLRRIAPAALVASLVGAWLTVVGGSGETLGFAVGFAAAPGLAATYVALIAGRVGTSPGRLGRWCETAGRASLSIYLLESVVATTIAYGYGLGRFGVAGPLEGVVLALAIWLGLVVATAGWLQIARQGPFEWLLRTVTHRTRQPLWRRPPGS